MANRGKHGSVGVLLSHMEKWVEEIRQKVTQVKARQFLRLNSQGVFALKLVTIR